LQNKLQKTEINVIVLAAKNAVVIAVDMMIFDMSAMRINV
jgi:hypothetical protein